MFVSSHKVRTSPTPWLPLLLLMGALIVAFAVLAAPRRPVALAAAADLIIYGDALSSGWDDWSWNSTRVFDNNTPVQSGSASLALTYNAAWAGLSLRTVTPLDTSAYQAIEFWIYGSNSGTSISVYLQESDGGDGLTVKPISANPGAWNRVTIPLTELGNPAQIARINWQDATGAAQTTFYLDHIRLIAAGDPTTATATATPVPGVTPTPTGVDVTLSIDVAADRRAISDYIYGIHYVEDESFAQEIDLPVRRWGGNDTTRYNWQNGMFGNPDWYFENEYKPTSADDFVDKNQRTGADSIITMPMSGWVAKDPGQVGDSSTYACSFDTRKYNYTPQPYRYGDGSIARPASDPADPNRSHCGSGITGYQNGRAIYFQGNDPADTSIAVDATWATDWIAHLIQTHGAADGGGVRFYGLDNEPDLWHETHRDVFPTALNYDQMRDRAYDYAAAIKAADPAAQILGPVLMGWTYYWHSPRDGQQELWSTRPDRMAHGDVPLVPWYLQQMKAYEDQHGVRLLDYLDLHYYPQSGVSLRSAGDANLQALRLRSTRSLWDATYVDESWIAQAGPEGGIVMLIPRMREWVEQNYPGTKLAMTEYNWGGLDHINGALTQADVLGIFGREGLDLATLFDTGYSDGAFSPNGPTGYTFRMFRNYDGNGAKFGDVSVHAASSDQGKLAIYAAQRNLDNAVTVLVINKTGAPLTANLTISNLQSPTAAVYRYSAANLNAIVKAGDQAINDGVITASFPANSLTLFVLLQADVPVDPGYQIFLPNMSRDPVTTD